jgi:hypothetical protein
LSSIAAERSSIIVFPLPMDLIAPLLGKGGGTKEDK